MKVRINRTISKNVNDLSMKLCKELDLYHGTYIEMLIRADLKRRKIETGPKMEVVENWTNPDDMPLHLEMRVINE